MPAELRFSDRFCKAGPTGVLFPAALPLSSIINVNVEFCETVDTQL